MLEGRSALPWLAQASRRALKNHALYYLGEPGNAGSILDNVVSVHWGARRVGVQGA